MTRSAHRCISTYSGKNINSLLIDPSQILPSDIARSLAIQVRYLGHTREPHSVAEHSVFVSRLAEYYNESLDGMRAALMHDAHEAYTGDFPSPYKVDVEGLREWEDKIEATVQAALGLPPRTDPVWKAVKEYDTIALHYEARELKAVRPDWVDEAIANRVPKHLVIECWGWHPAMLNFQRRAQELGFTGF